MSHVSAVSAPGLFLKRSPFCHRTYTLETPAYNPSAGLNLDDFDDGNKHRLAGPEGRKSFVKIEPFGRLLTFEGRQMMERVWPPVDYWRLSEFVRW